VVHLRAKYDIQSEAAPPSLPQTSPRGVPKSPHKSHEIWYSMHAYHDHQEWRWIASMYKTKRLALVLTPAEKTAVVQMADAEGGLSQSALVRRLIRNAARERGMWPPDRQQRANRQSQEVRHG
jgi:hypothetical protein